MAVVELQGIPDMKAVALCQLFRNHAHITILHTDHAPFFHCHIAGQNIEIQFHFSVSQQGDATNIVILVIIGIFDPGKVDRIDWCDFCRYIVVRNTRNSSKLFDIVHKQGIKGIVGSHIPLGAVGGFQLTDVNTAQLPFVQIPRLMGDLVRRFFQPFRSVGLIAIQPQASPNCLPGGVLGLNAGILTSHAAQK